MKKYFVLFCQLNKTKPQLYKTLQTINKKIKVDKSLLYESFVSEQEAKQFLQPKILSYAQILSSQEINQQNKENLVNNTVQISIPQNLKHVYRKILRYQGKDIEYFRKSPIKTKILQNETYYGFFDGCSKGVSKLAGIGFLITDKKGKVILQNCYNVGIQTNNSSESLALVFLMLDSLFHGIQHLQVFGDSQLVINGVNGKYKITHPNIRQYSQLSIGLVQNFESFQIKHIKRDLNVKADKLSNEGLKKQLFY